MKILSELGVRERRKQNKDELFAAGYCTDCGNLNDRIHTNRTCSRCLRDARRYYNAHKEARVNKLREWTTNNTGKLKECRKRRTKALKLAALAAYGGICQCCGESNPLFLCIDHINGGGYKHRMEIRTRGSGEFYYYLKKNKYPTDPPLQVLCFNCNQGRQLNNGICPHKEINEEVCGGV